MTVLLAFAWNMVILVSLAGWGTLCARYVLRDPKADLGLRLGWGVAIVLALGGCLLAAHLAKAPVLVLVTLAGVAAVVHEVVLRRGSFMPWVNRLARDVMARPGTAALAAVIVSIVVVRLAAAPFQRSSTFRVDDDAVAYLIYPKEMADSGATVQPFSDRHPLSFNGQSLLQALLVPVLRVELAYGLDAGVFLVIVVAVLVGASSRPWLRRAPLAMLPELAFVLLPTVRINLASTITGIAGLLVVGRTLERLGSGPAGRRNAAVVGLCIAAVATLRTFYIPVLATVVLVTYGFGALRARRGERKARVVEGLVVCGATFLALVPWMIVNYQSDATPLYPFLHGTVRALYPRFHDALYDLRVIERALVSDAGFSTTLVAVLAGLGIPEATWRRPRAGIVLGAGVALVTLAVLRQGAMQVDINRYSLPTFVAAVLFIAVDALRPLSSASLREPSVRLVAPMVLVMFALVLDIHESRGVIGAQYEDAIDTIHEAERGMAVFREKSRRYAQMQATMEPGTGVLLATEEGYLFDFGRNHLMTLDHPGLAGPAPGFPVGESDEAYVRYLRQGGVRYIAFEPGAVDPYSMGIWAPRAREPNDHRDPSRWLQSDWAPVLVPVLTEVIDLTTKYRSVYKDGGYVIVDLTAPAT